jgi:hypothetical protein
MHVHRHLLDNGIQLGPPGHHCPLGSLKLLLGSVWGREYRLQVPCHN